jgi:UDP-glucose 4-epimerase
MKNILVTGGAGYIGSHTVVELVKAGYRPIIIDNFSNSEKSVIDALKKITGNDIPYYEHELHDELYFENILRTEKIDGIIHFAAYKAVGESCIYPLKYYENNVSGLIKLLSVANKVGVENIVFSSSCTVYGEAEHLPLTEVSSIKPAASPYGATKQMGEIILSDSTKASKSLKSLSMRYFNPIGAHQTALIGELPKGTPSILVPYITQVVAGWREQLTVFGDDYPTPDGTCIRDYIHVVDLAGAHVKALEYIEKQHGGFYDVFNIGTGVGSSVMEIIKSFEKITKQKVNYKIGERRPGDVISSYAAVDKSNKILNWQFERTIEEALADAWRWQLTLGPK